MHPLQSLFAVQKVAPIATAVQRKLKVITKTCPCNQQRFLALKIENFQLKNFDIFLIFAKNIHCGYTLEPPRRGGSNEYPQCMFWIKNNKIRYTPANPSFFFYIKVGYKGVYIAWTCFLMRAPSNDIAVGKQGRDAPFAIFISGTHCHGCSMKIKGKSLLNAAGIN